ncbi:ATP-binding protein [Actinoallomurus bryophytorum]|nr:ATP-binding protein [Actinoallomurus bryophytorum]
MTRLALAEWGMNAIVDNALIITAELVTNAVKIGEVLHLTLSQQDGTVLVEVWDSSEAAPDRKQRSFDRVDGRGLLLVEACAKDWGWRLENRGGKTIWARVGDLDAEPDASEIPPPRAVRM